MKKKWINEAKEIIGGLIFFAGCALVDMLFVSSPADGVQQAWVPVAMLALSAASMIGGAISNVNAKKEQEKLLKEERARLAQEKREHQAWYDREYYQNPMETEEAKAAQATAREYLDDENKKADSRAAMTGASDEARVAQRGESQKAWTNMVRGITAKATDYKRALNSQYWNGKQGFSAQESGLASQQMGMEQERAASGTAMIGNGLQLGGSAIMGMQGGGTNKTLDVPAKIASKSAGVSALAGNSIPTTPPEKLRNHVASGWS